MKFDFEAIVAEALTQPGKLHERYTAFHTYSLGNQWLAMAQLGRAEPINTYPGWLKLGRHVKKREKAIQLLMPLFLKAKHDVAGNSKDEDDDDRKMIFVAKNLWFCLHQTDGEEFRPTIPGFDIEKAERELNITVEPFAELNGNCQGYAKTDKRVIAVSPIAYDGFKTAAHEITHCLIHPNTVSADETTLPRDAKEVEAELGAYLVKSALGLTQNLEYSRGYIQGWISDGTVEKVRFGKVFGAADQILKAGAVEPMP